MIVGVVSTWAKIPFLIIQLTRSLQEYLKTGCLPEFVLKSRSLRRLGKAQGIPLSLKEIKKD
jgi:hypothetical protein